MAKKKQKTEMGNDRPIEHHTCVEGGAERTFQGWKLGTVRVNGTTITAFFVTEDDDDHEDYMLTITEQGTGACAVDEVRRDYTEYHFLSYYGIALGWRLVWSPKWQPQDNERISNWFKEYERWGI